MELRDCNAHCTWGSFNITWSPQFSSVGGHIGGVLGGVDDAGLRAASRATRSTLMGQRYVSPLAGAAIVDPAM